MSDSKPKFASKITREEERLEHWISDYELTLLDMNKRDNIVEIFWGAIGVALGAFAPACASFGVLVSDSPDQKFGVLNFAECALLMVGLVVAGIMGFFWRNRAKASANLVDVIRARPKVDVTDFT